MIEYKSRFGYGKCIVDMDSQETLGETICCDLAEECDYDEEVILKCCVFARKMDGRLYGGE